jgi:hypothetical protein
LAASVDSSVLKQAGAAVWQRLAERSE